MKRVLLALGMALVLMLGALPGLMDWAGRDGLPPDDSDFAVVRAEVAPEENAYTYFLQATNSLVESTSPTLWTDYLADQPVDEGAVRDLLEKNADGLAQLKRGTEFAICQTPLLESVEMPVPYIHPWLTMSRMLVIRTRMAWREGRHGAAMDDAITGMRFGNLVQQDASSLITYLVGVAIFSASAEQAQELARDPATPPELRIRLVGALEEFGPFDGGLRMALRAEYRMGATTIDDLLSRPRDSDLSEITDMDLKWNRWWLRRMGRSNYFFKPNQTRKLYGDFYRRVIADIPRIYADQQRKSEEPEPRGWEAYLRPNAGGRLLLGILEPGLGRILERRCQMDGVLSGTKLAVACVRFEQERGRPPEGLQELVAGYLTEVPVDPFDGKSFRYSAEKGIAWSVGKNLTDEGGSRRVLDHEGHDCAASQNPIHAEDLVFDVRVSGPEERQP